MTATMKAITVASAGAQPQVTSDLPIPEPGEGQILIRSIYTAINPVDAIMAEMGVMVESWPFSPGCDAGGVVVATGPNAISPFGKPFEKGEKVFGCTKLGAPGHSPWGEYYLMEACVALTVPPKLTLEEASTLGVGLLTASVGVFSCLDIPLPKSASTGVESGGNESEKPWALVLGGASSVGFAAVQLLRASGHRVVTTCSERSTSLLEGRGASCVSYRLEADDLITRVASVTNGQVRYIFDAVGQNNDLVVALMGVLARNAASREGGGVDDVGKVAFTSTNAFAPLPVANNLTTQAIQLGPIGRQEAKTLNDAVGEYNPVLYGLLDSGKVVVGPYQLEGQGIEGILGAWNVQKSGKVAGKVIIKIADE